MASTVLRFLWWNVQSFAEYDVRRATKVRWPTSAEAYQEKKRRVGEVIRTLSGQCLPDLIALAEITETAANDLCRELSADYKVFALAELYTEPNFHLSLLYRSDCGFGNEDFIPVSAVPTSTRPMATIDFRWKSHVFRFFVCHWTARFQESGERSREVSALTLSKSIFAFTSSAPIDEVRHVIVLGDLNEEPFGILEKWLHTSRDRRSATRPSHYSDKDLERLRLYNCSWRFTGEAYPHPPSSDEYNVAGSYYWREARSWHTYDHVLVSGSLLNSQPPLLDETSLLLASRRDLYPSSMLGEDGLPRPFQWNDGNPKGVSDHLPLTGCIILDEGEKDNVRV